MHSANLLGRHYAVVVLVFDVVDDIMSIAIILERAEHFLQCASIVEAHHISDLDFYQVFHIHYFCSAKIALFSETAKKKPKKLQFLPLSIDGIDDCIINSPDFYACLPRAD